MPIHETLKGFTTEQCCSGRIRCPWNRCSCMKERIGGSSPLKKKGSVVVTYSRCRVCESRSIWFLEGIFHRDEASNDIIGCYDVHSVCEVSAMHWEGFSRPPLSRDVHRPSTLSQWPGCRALCIEMPTIWLLAFGFQHDIAHSNSVWYKRTDRVQSDI